MIKMENIHKCSICVEEFRNPKIIPCFHTFCRDCLFAYVKRVKKRGKFNCPICRAVVENPKNGVDGFQTNFYIEEKNVKPWAPSKNEETSHPLKEIKEGVCGKHEAEKLSIYCEDCKVPCCRDCKIEAHDGHTSIKLEEKADKLIKNAEDTICVIKTKIESMQKWERELNEEMKTVKKEKGIVEEEITKRKTLIEAQLVNKVDATIAELSHLTEKASSSVEEKLKKVTCIADELQNANAMIERTIESQDPLELLQAITNVGMKLNMVETKTRAIQVYSEHLFSSLDFQATDVAIESALDRAIGKVFLKKKSCNFRKQLKTVSDFIVDLKNNTKYFVKVMLPVGENNVWLAIRSKMESDNNTLMKKFRKNGSEIISFSLKGLVNSMSNFADGTVAVTMPLENKICIIEGGDNVYELASVKHPIGIACGSDELFVCSVVSSDIKDIKPYNGNRVLVLSKNGAVKRSIEFFDGRRLFTYPGKISVNHKGEIVVLDFAKNKIISLDQDGRPKHTCHGGNDVYFGKVLYDESGYVFVDTSEGIHVLDNQLKVVQTYALNFDVNKMVSMGVGQNGLLYTVNDVLKVSVWKYI